MAFNFRSSGSKQVFLDDSQLSDHRYYRFPNETGTFVTSVSTGSFPFTASRAVSSSYAISASHLIGGGGATISNAGDNRIITSDGTSTGLVAESNIQFSDNRLSITGSVTASQFTGSNLSGLPAFIGLVTSASFVQVVTGSSTGNIIPTWPQYVTVICIGGGGGGGAGSPFTGAKHKSGGAGGSGGEVVINRFKRSEISASIQFTIGGGGGSGSVGSNADIETGQDGQDGGVTIFGWSGATNMRPLRAWGGRGGKGGITTTSSPTLARTNPTSGRGSHYFSLGCGGGGAGGYSTTHKYSGNLPWVDAPNLPYTINDIHRQSALLTPDGAATDYGVLQINGTPAGVTTTGGGGGYGGNNFSGSSGLHQSSNLAYGLPGRILNANFNTGARTGVNANQDYTQQGIVGKDFNNYTDTAPYDLFLGNVLIGMGGRSGYANGTAWNSAMTAPMTGSRYGGGGGGGSWRQSGADGGAGGIIIIYEA